NHQVKGVRRVAAVSLRIREWAYDVQKLHDRPRPAVRDDQWQRVWLVRAHMQEVHDRAVDLCRELRERVELSFVLAPVVRGVPVLGELFEVAHWNAVAPANPRQLIGPPGPSQPPS